MTHVRTCNGIAHPNSSRQLHLFANQAMYVFELGLFSAHGWHMLVSTSTARHNIQQPHFSHHMTQHALQTLQLERTKNPPCTAQAVRVFGPTGKLVPIEVCVRDVLVKQVDIVTTSST